MQLEIPTCLGYGPKSFNVIRLRCSGSMFLTKKTLQKRRKQTEEKH